MSEFVLIGTCYSQIEADMMKAYLEEAGIKVLVESDDAGGVLPQLTFINGIKFLVLEKDVPEARKIFADHKGLSS